MKTFQKPLSAQEEARCLQQMREGGEEAMEARRILIERNLRLVAHVAKKYQGPSQELDDLISTGSIGLIKAVDSFNQEKGSRLATYAVRCIDNELLMMFRSRKKISREVSIYDPIGTDKEGNEISLLDVIENEQQDIVDRMEIDEKLKVLPFYLKSCLTERERQIIFMRYGLTDGHEMTQREIGERLSISRSYVSRIEKKALRKMLECYMNTDRENKAIRTGGYRNAICKSVGLESGNEACETDLQ